MNIRNFNTQETFIKLFLYICIILPTGQVFGINFKMLVLFLVILTMFKKQGAQFSLLLIRTLPAIMILFIFVFYTLLINTFTFFAFAQAKDILVFFIFTIICYTIIDKSEQYRIVGITVINALVLMAFVKIGIIVLSFLTGMSISTIVKLIASFFNVSLMSYDIENSSIGRISFTSDIILPYAIFVSMFTCLKIKGNAINYLKLFLLLFSLLINMSRFYWMAGLVCVLLSFLTNIKNKKVSFIICFTLAILIIAINIPSVSEMIEVRFSSKLSDASDSARLVQLNFIMDAFNSRPLLGHGLGYYIPNMIRGDENTPYSYELQVPALMMQIGLIGCLILFGTLSMILMFRTKGIAFKYKFTLLVMIILWFSSGFLNPVLFSSAGGIVFLFLFMLPIFVKEKKDYI